MEITGCDNVIFTTARPEAFINRFVSALRQRWPAARVNLSPTDGPDVGFVDAAEIVIDPSLPARWVLLAVRDSEMDQFFDENAYAVMPDGEGPFALWWRVRSRVAFKCGTVDEVEAGDKGPVGGPEPYTAWLCGPSIGELTVVTPDDPETHPFSRWLCETVRAACVGSG